MAQRRPHKTVRIVSLGAVAIAGSLALLLALLYAFNGETQSASAVATEEEPRQNAETDTTEFLTRADVRVRLRELAESPSPGNLSSGGCLYPSMPPDTVFYVCPRCKKKTPHIDSSIKWFIWDKLRPSRSLVSAVTNLFVALNERGFCGNCRSRIPNPELCLEVRCRGESEVHRTCGISRHEVTLLTEFLRGERKHTERTGRQTSLKFYLRVLEGLLGVTAYPDTSEIKGED